jgi:hypothetical protein
MVTIRDLLDRHVPGSYADKKLAWGAKASAYLEEIEQSLDSGYTPVLVELDYDLPIPRERCLLVDHHGPRAGEQTPTALEQVFKLLALEPSQWTRWHALVAANDRGYIPEMRRMGATIEEIRDVRQQDRRAQGITADDEARAMELVRSAEAMADGRLTVVRSPHPLTSALGDVLHADLGGPGYQNLLTIGPGEVRFNGEGRLVRCLAETFPRGWYGGALPSHGYWGTTADSPDDVLSLLLSALSA